MEVAGAVDLLPASGAVVIVFVAMSVILETLCDMNVKS